MAGPANASHNETAMTTDRDDKGGTTGKATEPSGPQATLEEVFSFVPNTKTKILMIFGLFFAACSGVIFPAMAWIFSGSFSDLSASTDSDAYMRAIRELAFSFIALGVVAFALMTAQTLLMELAASEVTRNFKKLWFQALLRQDMAYYDLRDVSGTATTLSANAIKFKRGIGRKLSDGVQFFVTVILGLIYGFWSSWQTSLMVLTVIPFMGVSATILVKLATTQTARSSASYAKAGSVVYTTISSIRTILSLNAVDTMVEKFVAATDDAYEGATADIVKFGFANGAMMASFLFCYVVVVLYGSYLVYSRVREDGCDPSGSAIGNESCSPNGEGVFGALFGVSFAGAVMPQITTCIEAMAAARSAAYPALEAMYRDADLNEGKGNASAAEGKQEALHRRGSAVSLPKYAIDSSSPKGLKPEVVKGHIRFHNVSFCYPSRLESLVFNGFNLDVPEGKTVALIGTSGGGKSTVVQLIERFYDVTSGSITLDGNDIRSLNVQWLRSQIGLVSQEPKLFALSIRENIAIGCPGATSEQIEEAARKANAHDFIVSFRDGYDTQCGDQGAQLSGGQKQRIAIARVLISKPKIILLDEATSALDSESEAVVQEALDVLMKQCEQTILVIAHRLSTIKGADVIAVVSEGKVVETGSHEELLARNGAYFELVNSQKGKAMPHDEIFREVESDSYPQLVISSNQESVEVGNNGTILVGNSTVTKPALELKDVHFWYPSRPGNKIFSGLNLAIQEGETMAIVGPSGQGKSTVFQLIEQFYRPSAGIIEYQGVDMKELNIHWIRNEIALVSQEPVLFDSSIAENIRFGTSATDDEIEEAARKANAHDFISAFPDGYSTQVGGGSSLQVSGGQKQRIAIARALIRKPKVLLLDEATSALDSASEKIVQDALDKIMAEKSQTTIVIAHRLSTLRNVERIAFIEMGQVRELGTHDELMAIHNGRYKHLQALQDLGSSESNAEYHGENDGADPKGKDETVEVESDDVFIPDKERDKKNAQRARLLAKSDRQFFVMGGIGAIFAGLVFPGWGFVFAYMVLILYYPVQFCDDSLDPPIVPFPQYSSCQEYWDEASDYMRDLSFKVFYGLLGIIGCAIVGNILMYTGFGYASERLNKRIRDDTFKSLVRQEVAWFDMQPIGKITTRLSDDTTLIHSFSGQPIRMLCVNLASVLIGLVVSLVYMWPFALVTLAILPFMSVGKALEIQTFMADEGGEVEDPMANSSAGIVVESLLNIRTVASLTIEGKRLEQFDQAMTREDPHPIRSNFLKSSTGGFSQIIQYCGFALMFWFGGWLLFNFPNEYDFQDFLISMFGLMFGMTGIGIAMQDMTDSKKASEAAERIFEIIDRQSEIDPLNKEGKKLN